MALLFFLSAQTDLNGVPFSYDETSGRVSVARESPMWRPEPDRRRRE